METEMKLQTRETTIKLETHRHEVKFVEDLKIEGGEGVLCPECGELLSGRGFKCPVCNYLCHESCGLLKDGIRHPLHPAHPLDLRFPSRYAYCNACGKSCHKCSSYFCPECNFTLDIKCASRWRVKKNACDNHAFVPLVEQILFTCNFCGEKGEGNVCICSVCLLTIHSECARFSRTIKISDHPHSLTLTLTYSAHEVEEHEKQEEEEQADIVCKLCSEKVNTKYASYFCAECRCAVHLRCGRDREVMEDRDVITGSLPVEYHGRLTPTIKDLNREFIKSRLAGNFKHFSHQHELILNSEVTDDIVCDGCMQLISVPFYSCTHCNFFLHSLCANLPQNATYEGTPRNYTLLPRDDVFLCYHCGRYRHGFAYKCEVKRLIMDLQCFIFQGKLLHKGHQHPLFARYVSSNCNSCGRATFLSCSTCNFSLCNKCATFPLEVNCKFDPHPLKMTYTIEDDYEKYYCFICEKERNPKHWFYYCATCDFSAHLQCIVGEYSYIKFGKTYKDEGHPHPLTFVEKTFESPPCDACGLDFNGVALHCKECEFNVHPHFDGSDGDFDDGCLGKINKVRHISSSC